MKTLLTFFVLLLVGISNSSFAKQLDTKGKFGGLGIEITMEEGYVKVVSLYEDAPAYKSGIQAGDYIIQINDTPVLGLTISEVVELMRGKKGTAINLTISRKGVDPFEVEIIRDIIEIRQSIVAGLMNDFCHVVLDYMKEGDDLTTLSIALEESMYGFLSGFNAGSGKDTGEFKNLWFDFGNKEKIHLYLIDNCQKNPDKKLYMVMLDYFITLKDYE